MPKLGFKHSVESKLKMRNTRLERGIKPTKKPPVFTGKTHTLEVRKRISEAQKRLVESGIHRFLKDGKSKERMNERQLFMNTLEYKFWRTSVFRRDNYTCTDCGIRSKKGLGSVVLEAHHIKSYNDFPELRTELSNGLTLCQNCHKREGRPKQND